MAAYLSEHMKLYEILRPTELFYAETKILMSNMALFGVFMAIAGFWKNIRSQI